MLRVITFTEQILFTRKWKIISIFKNKKKLTHSHELQKANIMPDPIKYVMRTMRADITKQHRGRSKKQWYQNTCKSFKQNLVYCSNLSKTMLWSTGSVCFPLSACFHYLPNRNTELPAEINFWLFCLINTNMCSPTKPKIHQNKT